MSQSRALLSHKALAPRAFFIVPYLTPEAQARNFALFTSLWTCHVGNSVGNESLDKRKGASFLG